MRTFLMGSLPGLTAIAIVAATGYLRSCPRNCRRSNLRRVRSPAIRAGCAVCRLTLYGHEAGPSKLGPNRRDSEQAAATRD